MRRAPAHPRGWQQQCPRSQRTGAHLEQHVLVAADGELGAGVLGVHHAVARLSVFRWRRWVVCRQHATKVRAGPLHTRAPRSTRRRLLHAQSAQTLFMRGQPHCTSAPLHAMLSTHLDELNIAERHDGASGGLVLRNGGQQHAAQRPALLLVDLDQHTVTRGLHALELLVVNGQGKHM